MIRFLAAAALVVLPVVASGGSVAAHERAQLSPPDHPTIQVATMAMFNAPPFSSQVAHSGVTKPAGAPLDSRLGTKPALDAESRRLDRLIRTSVCSGC